MVEPPDEVIVVGAGLSGLATAVGVARHGRRVVVFEAADAVGGAAAYSGGQVWVGANHVARRSGVDDDLERTERYVRAIAQEHPELLDEVALRRFVTTAPVAIEHWEQVGAVTWSVIDGLADYHTEAEGALASGRYLTGEPFDGAALGPWRDRLRTSPYFRPGITYSDMLTEGRRRTTSSTEQVMGDPLTLGTGLVAGFLARALGEVGIEVVLESRVTGLLRDAATVVGVHVEGKDGPVERRGPVVLATSSFDGNPALVQELLGLDDADFGTMAPESIRGDGITLARAVGADVAKMPPTCVPMVPGWRLPGSAGIGNGPEYAMPHAMIVDRSGRRFCNDSYWVDLVPKALDATDPHLPFFLIVDEQHHRRYGLGDTPPGGDYPHGLVTTAATLAELGAALGIDGEQLERTAATFNEHAARGHDPEFGRGSVDFINRFSGDPDHAPSPVLGPIIEPLFHGLRLILLGTAIGSSGVRIDADGHVLDPSGDPIPGLYAVGSCAATTTFGSGYNSGMALSRGLTLAYLVSNELGRE
jgi:3-oxosteroid 1-dehydrogenase